MSPERVREAIGQRYDLQPYDDDGPDPRWWNTLRQAARVLGGFVRRPPAGHRGDGYLTPAGVVLKARVLARDRRLRSFWSGDRWMRYSLLRTIETRRVNRPEARPDESNSVLVRAERLRR
jgi:hypothetical protein